MEQSVRNVIGTIDFINKQNGRNFKFFLRMPKDKRILRDNSIIVERSQLVEFFQLAIVPFCLQISIFTDALSVTRWIKMNCLKLIIISLRSKVKNVQCMILLSIVYYHMTAMGSPGRYWKQRSHISPIEVFIYVFSSSQYLFIVIYSNPIPIDCHSWTSRICSVFELDLKIFCEWVLPYLSPVTV